MHEWIVDLGVWLLVPGIAVGDDPALAGELVGHRFWKWKQTQINANLEIAELCCWWLGGNQSSRMHWRT